MEKKEFAFNGMKVNGFIMLFVNLILTFLAIAGIVYGIILDSAPGGVLIGASVTTLIATFFIWSGFVMLEPNETRVMVFFGKYKGTFTDTGYFWVNPFLTTKKLSLRARNLDAEPIKVNDKTGNPVMIGLVLVWKLKDTYKAMFEIDSQTMAQAGTAGKNEVTIGTSVTSMMNAFENFVKTQSDAALRQVAGRNAAPPAGFGYHHCPRKDCGGSGVDGQDGTGQTR